MNNEEKILAMLERMESRQNKTETMLEHLRQGQATLQADVSDIKERLNGAEEHLAKVAVTQENLVLPKIDLLAEGHGEIIDRLKSLKDIESEQEEHDRRIWVLEQSVRAK